MFGGRSAQEMRDRLRQVAADISGSDDITDAEIFAHTGNIFLDKNGNEVDSWTEMLNNFAAASNSGDEYVALLQKDEALRKKCMDTLGFDPGSGMNLRAAMQLQKECASTMDANLKERLEKLIVFLKAEEAGKTTEVNDGIF
jgi:hypothetical protein